MQLDGMSITAILASVGYSHRKGGEGYGKHIITDCEGVEIGHMDARQACEFLRATGVLES